MKSVLIVGKNSYVGRSFKEFCFREKIGYTIDFVSSRDNLWQYVDFSNYNVVINVAGIAHVRETRENEEMYYKVNRDLAINIAEKAKNDGVNHFIFLSSMSVYGESSGVIKKTTEAKPKTAYGKSKLQAEKKIWALSNSEFNVTILRPPMIYGPLCKGNYQKLAAFSLKTIVFPNINNQRSMIFIDNLSSFIQKTIQLSLYGIQCPQNEHYINVSEMVEIINEIHEKKIILLQGLSFIKFIPLENIQKVFGSLTYDKEMSNLNIKYNICDFKTSLIITEKRGRI